MVLKRALTCLFMLTLASGVLLAQSADLKVAHTTAFGPVTPAAKPSPKLTTIFSNLGPTSTNAYNDTTGYYILGPDNSVGLPEQGIGVPFIPAANSHVEQLQVALGWESGTSLVNVGLYSDNAGVVGTLLSSGHASTIPVFGTAPSSASPTRPDWRFRPQTLRPRRRTHLYRRHRQTPARLRHRRQRHLRTHRLPRNARRPRQNASSQSPRRNPASPRRSHARRRRRRTRHRPHRHGRRQSLRLRKNRRQARSRLRRIDREHRHRRPVDDPLRRQEFSRRRHRHFAPPTTIPSPRNCSAKRQLSLATKWRLAQKAFATTAAYDSAIASTLERISPDSFQLLPETSAFPQTLRFSFHKTLDLRYGENPHQKAAMYSDGSGAGVANARQLQGKELSYNNIVDLQAAWDLAQEFDEPVRRHHQTHQPLRHRHRQDSHRSLQTRPRMRSRLRLRRRDRRKSPHRRRSRRGNAQTFPRSHRRPRFSTKPPKPKFATKKNLRLVQVIEARTM
jgi:hypothetical protein